MNGLNKIKVVPLESHLQASSLSPHINQLDAGHAYQGVELENGYNIHQGQDLFGGDSRQPGDEKRIQRLAKQKRKEEWESKQRERDQKRQHKEEKKWAGETNEVTERDISMMRSYDK